MAKYKPQYRLNKNYNKICPICKKQFYEKRLNVKYCSDNCREKGNKIIQKRNAKKWYKEHKKHLLEYQRKQYRKKHPK